MQIQCTIEREGGTEVTLQRRTYHFQPNQHGHHVAEVENTEDMKRLLQIDAYRPYGEQWDEAELDEDGEDLTFEDLERDDEEEADVEPVSDEELRDGQPVPEAGAVKTDREVRDNEATEEEADSEEATEVEGEPVEGDQPMGDDEPVEGDGKMLEQMNEAELIEEHTRVFGKSSHPSMKVENLRTKLINERDGNTD